MSMMMQSKTNNKKKDFNVPLAPMELKPTSSLEEKSLTISIVDKLVTLLVATIHHHNPQH
jgi:hypothetical protein